MLRTPRFIISSDKKGSSQIQSQDVEWNKSNSNQIESTELKNLGFKSYAVVNEPVTAALTEFVTKIFNSILRQDVQIISQWSDDTDLNAVKNIFEQTSSQDFNTYLQVVSGFKNSRNKDNLGLVVNFQESKAKTEAQISESWICISTYSIQEILTQPSKKAEFWNFLKHLKF